MVMIDPDRIQRLAAKLVNRKDALEMVHQMRCGGRKYPGGGKFFRTNLQNESPLMYQPMMPINYPIETPLRFRPEPDLGDYQAPASTGMIVNYPISLPERVPVSVQEPVSAPVVVEVPERNLFSDEMIARRALKQRYAESAFNDKAKSKAGAQGAWQIMPITLKDYLGRGRGKVGDLNDPEYNRKVRDWVMGIIPRDLKEFWSESDSDRAKLAKLYAAYNWGAGNLRGFLRKKRDAGIDISNPDNWVDDLNPETRRYVKYLAFDEDIPDSTVYTNAAFEKAAADRGYAEGGSIHIAPSKRGTFTAAAKKHGKSVQAFASQVLAHKENYSPAMVKKANFARNSKKWKHGDGGPLDKYGDDAVRAALLKLRDGNKFDGETEKSQQMEIAKLKKPPVWQRLLGVPRQIMKMSNGKIDKNNIGVLYTYPEDWATRIYSEDELNTMRQNLYDNFVPVGYDLTTLRAAADVANGLSVSNPNKDVYDKDVRRGRLETYFGGLYNPLTYPAVRDEAFAKYLLPAVERKRPGAYLVETDQRPESGATYDRVYKFNREMNPYFASNLVDTWAAATSGKKKVSHPADINGDVGSVIRETKKGKSDGRWVVTASGAGLFGTSIGGPEDSIGGSWTLSTGVDPQRGQFVSFYDDYDLNPSLAGKTAGPRSWFGAYPIKTADTSGGLGHPYSIYDRVYLDDYYGVDSRPKNPDELYGGYITPSTVIFDRKSEKKKEK